MCSMWGQNVSVGSLMMPLESAEGSGQIVVLEHENDQWTAGDEARPHVSRGDRVRCAPAPNCPPIRRSSTLTSNSSATRFASATRPAMHSNETQDSFGPENASSGEPRSREGRSTRLFSRDASRTVTNELQPGEHLSSNVVEEHARHLEIHRLHYNGELEALRRSRGLSHRRLALRSRREDPPTGE